MRTMQRSLRVVMRIPLDELWDEQGTIVAMRGERLGPDEIAAITRRGPIQFIVADAGLPLHWVPLEERFIFWNSVAGSTVSGRQYQLATTVQRAAAASTGVRTPPQVTRSSCAAHARSRGTFAHICFEASRS